MQTRKAFRSETSTSLARRRGLTSKHVNTLTESDLMKAVMSFTEHVFLTLSTHRTVFFTNLFAADMFLPEVDILPTNSGPRRTCSDLNCGLPYTIWQAVL